jgi:hypothetical protein
VIVKLPRPASVGARSCAVLSLLFHPKLPLLYAWQDAEPAPGSGFPVAEDPALKDFEHLFVIALDGPAPEAILTLCRGQQFAIGGRAGTLALDDGPARLFVPNLLYDKGSDLSAGVGWFHLAADGLPVEGDEQPKTPPPAGARPARLAALKAALAAGKPVGAFRSTPPKIYGFHGYPCGAGIVPFGRDVILACGPFGAITWNNADRAARGCVFLLPVNFVTYYCTRLTVHPTLPVVYVSAVGYTYLYRMAHADGFITLGPQVVRLEGAAVRTPPVVMARRNAVAVGSTGVVYVAALDAEGRFKDEEGVQINVMSPNVDALAYSEKYDRLYVPVEGKR